MIGRSAASVWSRGPFGSRRTRRRASSGAWRAMGSSSAKRPSSYSIKAATVVSGFVIDAIRKIVSRSTGRFVTKSREPTLAVCTTRPSRHTRVAAPARAPAST